MSEEKKCPKCGAEAAINCSIDGCPNRAQSPTGRLSSSGPARWTLDSTGKIRSTSDVGVDPNWKGSGIDYAELELKLLTPERLQASHLEGRVIRKSAREFYAHRELSKLTYEQLTVMYRMVKLESFSAVYGSRNVGEVFGVKNPQPRERWEIAALGARLAVTEEILRRKEKKYVHDCDGCTFLGPYQKYDLYACNLKQPFPTVIARYGNEGGEYQSSLETARSLDWDGCRTLSGEKLEPWHPSNQHHPLVVAMHRAVVFGLLPSTEELIEKELDEKRNEASRIWGIRCGLRNQPGWEAESSPYQLAVFDYEDASFEVEKLLVKLGRQQARKKPWS